MNENKTDQLKQIKINKEPEKHPQRLNSVDLKKKRAESMFKNDKNDKDKTKENTDKIIEKVNKSNKNSDREKNKDKNRIKNLGIIKTFEREKLFPTEIIANFNKSQKNFMEPDRIQVGPK